MKYLLLITLLILQFIVIHLARESGKVEGMSEMLDRLEKDLKELEEKKNDTNF